VPIPVKVGFALEFWEFSTGCITTWKQWQALVLPGGKKLRLHKFSPYEFGFVINLVVWLWLCQIHMDRNTYTIKI